MKFVESNVPEGIKVFVRRFTDNGEYVTKCELIEEQSNAIVCAAESRCHPNDNPNRRIGRAIAVGRAIKTYFGGARGDQP